MLALTIPSTAAAGSPECGPVETKPPAALAHAATDDRAAGGLQAVRDTSPFGMHTSKSFRLRLYDLSCGSFNFDRRLRAIFPSSFKAGVRPQTVIQSEAGNLQDWFGKGAERDLEPPDPGGQV
jgi:hypothetical protein